MAEVLAAAHTTEEVGIRRMQRRGGRRSVVGISAAFRILPGTHAATQPRAAL
jgi:hypothetical protein